MYELLRNNIEKKIPLTNEEWELIQENVKQVKLKKNDYLQIQDSNSKYEAFVLNGAFKIYHLKENGAECILFFAFDNDWITDVESFYHDKLTRYNIKALEDCEILVINKINKTKLFKEVPKLLKFHTLLIEKTNIVMQDRLLDILNKTSKQRYLDFINKYPVTAKRINDRNLSSYLGVSHEFLCKIKKQFKLERTTQC